MSAIWGSIDFAQNSLPEKLSERMQKPLLEYKIDRYDVVQGKNIVMGCGIQHITSESVHERLPIYDANSGVYFTADCIVDNREDLIPELCPGKQEIADGELLFLAYLKWREHTAKYVFGSYAYAAYESKNKKLIISADHTFSRSIYYCRQGNIVYFSTVIESILCLSNDKPEINELCLSLFLAKKDLALYTNATDTFYKEIFRVQASHFVVFDGGGQHAVEYWSPNDVTPLHLGSDEEYKAYFRKLMQCITRQTLRSKGQTGVLLSSGLDSTAIAAYSAKSLENQGKKLYSYTYVPIEGYQSSFNSRYIQPNEQQGVELFLKMYPNIESKFLSVSEPNAIETTSRMQSILETPYKTHTNMVWLDKFAQLAAQDGCKIMLTGQMGNSTISAGDMTTYIFSRISQGRWIDAVKTANSFAKNLGIGRSLFAKRLLKEMIPSPIKGLKAGDCLDGTLVNRDYFRSLGVNKRDKRLGGGVTGGGLYTFQRERSLIYNPVAMGQVGESETKLYLKYGMVTRDITRDIRIFAFCLGAPMECFVGYGTQTRRLIRYYLSDMLPPALTDEKAPRGRQAADWFERLEPQWPQLHGELVRGCSTPALQKYLDMEAVGDSLKMLQNDPQLHTFNNLYKVYSAGVFFSSRE